MYGVYSLFVSQKSPLRAELQNEYYIYMIYSIYPNESGVEHGFHVIIVLGWIPDRHTFGDHAGSGTKWPKVSITTWLKWSSATGETDSQQICCYTMYEGMTKNTLHVLNDCNIYVYVHDIAWMHEHKTTDAITHWPMCKENLTSLSVVCTHTRRQHVLSQWRNMLTSPFQSTSSKPFKTYIQRSRVCSRSLLLIPSFRHLFLITCYLLLTSVSKLHPHLGVTLQFLGVKQPISKSYSSKNKAWWRAAYLGTVAKQKSSPLPSLNLRKRHSGQNIIFSTSSPSCATSFSRNSSLVPKSKTKIETS